MPVTAKFKAAQKQVMQARRRSKSAPPKRLTQQIQRVIAKSTESKFVDTLITGEYEQVSGFFCIDNDLATNLNVTPINLIQQGAANYNRIGNTVKLQSLRIKLHLLAQHGQEVTPSRFDAINNTLRMVVIYDRDGKTQPPDYDEIFGWRKETGTVATGLLSPIRPEFNERYRALLDETIPLNTPVAPPVSYFANNIPVSNNDYIYGYGDSSHSGTYHSQRVIIDRYIDLSKKNLSTRFSGTANPMTTNLIANGALYLVLKCVNANRKYESITVAANSAVRLRYTDM
jgi:hypothetical protein